MNPTLKNRRPWKLDAACATVDPETWYNPDQVHAAKKVCARCDVRDHCLGFALSSGEPWGVWGGFNAVERQRIHAGSRPRRCVRCRLYFVPRKADARHCVNCVDTGGQPSIDDVKEDIVRLAGQGWSDPMISAEVGYTVGQVRYARERWKVPAGREVRSNRWPVELLVPCGTPGAYRRHLRRNEPVDELCRQAELRRKVAA